MATPSVVYNYLGNSGLKVSNICLGTVTFGQTDGPDGKHCDEETSIAILNRFAELGGNFIDTADVYSSGLTEKIIGKWLKNQNRDEIIIGTKTFLGLKPHLKGTSRRNLIKDINSCLDRLQTDYIDVYQVHCWDEGTPIEETFRTLNDLVRQGKIRYIGVSNFCGWQLQKVVDYSKYTGLEPIVCLQNQYSLLCRTSENEEIRVCQNEGISLTPWSPLKGGLLTGKFKKGEAPSLDTRIGHENSDKCKHTLHSATLLTNDRYWTIINKLETISKKYGKTIAQVAIRWTLQRPTVTSAIVGARTVKQLEENMLAGNGWEMTQSEMAELNELSAFEQYYPYEMINYSNSDRIRSKTS